jgi:hypothetical protein
MYWNEYVFKRYLTRFKQIFFAIFTVHNEHVFITFKFVTVFLRNGEIIALVFNIHWNLYVRYLRLLLDEFVIQIVIA